MTWIIKYLKTIEKSCEMNTKDYNFLFSFEKFAFVHFNIIALNILIAAWINSKPNITSSIKFEKIFTKKIVRSKGQA